ncbi:hypothetical protein BHU72_14595 [Desulfuribacillus stibiiarsenatis]|uniref:DUF551 domain-containing protein n=1 Tax=Desulfuribacillus stibiiarsenatis TaxID=1390249 RepID=A0A1E5L7F9_9FIRM|nr:DUF551 domain-containing protein [Desulfuribacillus stibiiarsenatis]OEH86056.1 hypothetical protein BHU72_14595 [Desulfuribacillus stibiiarsenatis]
MNKWIDVNERMPETKKDCWVWVQPTNGEEGFCSKMYLSSSGRWHITMIKSLDDSDQYQVVAWQPYYEPEPYVAHK